MDGREQRGIIIAAMCRIERSGSTWLVPSQSAAEKRYTVDLATEKCTCPDCENGFVCKHIRAVKIVVQRETGRDGTVTETKEITFTEKKVYQQDWPAYNAAQTEEKSRFIVLLNALCDLITQPTQANGRPRLPLADMIFACVYKVYVGFSSRRFMSDLREAQTKERIYRAPH